MNGNAFHGQFMEDRDKAETDTEIFRMYLEEHGVLEVWTRVLSNLWTLPQRERPTNPLAYIIKELGGVVAGPVHARNKVIDELRHRVITTEGEMKIYSSRNQELLQQIEELEKMMDDLPIDDQEKGGKRKTASSEGGDSP